MYEASFRLRGKTYDYKIQYSSIKKFFLLPKNDEMHTLIVLGLDPPLRQGQTRYPFLVMQLKLDEEVSIELNMTEYVLTLSDRQDHPGLQLLQGTLTGALQRQARATIRRTHSPSHHKDLPRFVREESHYAIEGLC
jgi:hypothetical protein